MAEKCLIAASIVALIFHPSSTIKCFTPDTTSPPREKPKKPEKVAHAQAKRTPSKSKKTLRFPSNSSLTKYSKEAKTRLQFPPPCTRRSLHSDQVSELHEREWPIDIVKTMFRSGWPLDTRVVVEKILQVNHSVDVLNNFEEYREGVKSKSAKTFHSEAKQKLMVDGNELFRFHGALVACSLGTNEGSGVCQNKLCAVCRIVTSSFPVKDDSVTFYDNCRRAHENINRASVADHRLCARTAMIICRVIAGRVANYHQLAFMDAADGGFDSVVSSTGYQCNGSEELVALNPRAVLPCFVVIYRVNSS